MKQQTLLKTYDFEGKGLHTGKYAHVTLRPAPADTGIVFVRTDLGGLRVPALAENVSSTSRSTTISCGKASVGTIEHLMSAFTGLGVDNAIVEIDNKEMPILDGSARFYAEAISADGLQEQDAERRWLTFDHEIRIENKKTGSYIVITPSEEPSVQLTIDFNSRVLGVQTVTWTPDTDFSTEIAPCRTFCFLHEVQLLATLGLVKGGDVENAIVVVEKPISEKALRRLARRFGQPLLSVTPEGYLSNLTLRFSDECGRHKLLDLLGDLRLAGAFLKARVVAYKPGHALNTEAARQIRKQSIQ
ncbi:MAG: UDP-3-O-acyl-N-acetylglucosamine deacetylase [Candidatus Cryptobacteroides sp.]|nr:UDP-3-O-acyl-N-acetylglucosamine deacetylase [Candidatus Cryptobacteroides sp.]